MTDKNSTQEISDKTEENGLTQKSDISQKQELGEKNRDQKSNKDKKSSSSIFTLLSDYKLSFALALLLVAASDGLSLILPKLIGDFIDKGSKIGTDFSSDIWLLVVLVTGVFVIALIQIIFTNWFSERVAKNLRNQIIESLSTKTFSQVNKLGASDLITIFVSDVNNTKNFVSQGFVYLFTALVLLFGSITLMFTTNWQLALVAVVMLPVVIVVFGFVFSKIGPLFGEAQKNISDINLVVNESVFGAALVRVLNSQSYEEKKFESKNQTAKDINVRIVNLFAALLPIINLVSNIGIIAILLLGSQRISSGSLTLGQFSSFLSYYELLILPIFILGFTSQGIGRAAVSYNRIKSVINSPSQAPQNNNLVSKTISGDLKVQDLNLTFGSKKVLRDISFEVKSGQKVAVLGPTGAGKSQLFNILTGLSRPETGSVSIDNTLLDDWDKNSLLSQVGLVFQDSLVFNATLEQNIRFNNQISDQDLEKAIYTACLDEYVATLTLGIKTQVSERGTSLSGGQKQRLMLARALAINPKILLLDDFTARVDATTENQILERLKTNYPNLTLLSITQKIDPIKDFDQIIVLMEGEMVGIGKHADLLKTSSEYLQLWNSQQIFVK